MKGIKLVDRICTFVMFLTLVEIFRAGLIAVSLGKLQVFSLEASTKESAEFYISFAFSLALVLTIIYYCIFEIILLKDEKETDINENSFMLSGHRESRVYKAYKIELTIILLAYVFYFLFTKHDGGGALVAMIIMVLLKEGLNFAAIFYGNGNNPDTLLACIKEGENATFIHMNSNCYSGLATFKVRGFSDNIGKNKKYILMDGETSYIKYRSYIQQYLNRNSKLVTTAIEDIKIREDMLDYEKYKDNAGIYDNWFYRNIRDYLVVIDEEKINTDFSKMLTDTLNTYEKIPHVSLIALLKKRKQSDEASTIRDLAYKKGVVKYYAKTSEIKEKQLQERSLVSQEVLNTAVDTIYAMGKEYVDIYYNLYKTPGFTYELFKRIIQCDSYLEGVVKVLDYIDMIGSVYYYYLNAILSKYDAKIAENIGNYKGIADSVIEDLEKCEEMYWLKATIKDKIDINIIEDDLKYASHIFKLKANETNSLTFKGIFNVLQFLRNKTRGHGVIKAEQSRGVYCFLLKLCMIINRYLGVTMLKMKETENIVKIQFLGFEASMEPYIKKTDDRYYILKEATRDNLVYIDYLHGEFMIPGHMEERER
jgi:hypothetical protein